LTLLRKEFFYREKATAEGFRQKKPGSFSVHH
jgi:hypothetical protein